MKPGLERFVPIILRMSPTLGRLTPLFFVFLPFLGRFIPGFVSNFLNRTFESWKARGLIQDYRTSVTRAGILSYKIDIHFFLTKDQAKRIFSDSLTKANG